MFNYDTGEQYPCPRCGNPDCNGCNKIMVEKKSVAPQSPMVAELLKKAEELRAGVTITKNEEEVPVENFLIDDDADWKEKFIEAGRRGGMLGGKKGGNVTKLRGSEYYSKIAKLSWEKRRSATGM